MRIEFNVRDESGLDRLAAAAPSVSLMRLIGKRLEVDLRKWFRARDGEPNKRGWPKQHFWARIRNATAFDPEQTTDRVATVVIADPAFAAKVHGPTVIEPKEKDWLAIPMRPEVYGKWPSSGIIPGLFPLRRGEKLWLAARVNGALRLFYRLVKRVTLPPDPKALPPEGDVMMAVNEELDDYFAAV